MMSASTAWRFKACAAYIFNFFYKKKLFSLSRDWEIHEEIVKKSEQ